MASRPENERRCAYLTYRDTFCGSKARVRNRKVIRSIVLKHWAQSGVTPDEQHLTKTISALKALLKDRVFELEKLARKEFPDLFAKSPADSHPIARLSKDDVKAKESAELDCKNRRDNPGCPDPPTSDRIPTVEGLHCTRFPFEAQHHLLSRVQQLLEGTCFRFMQRWIPSTLDLNNWTSAAAIELTKSLSIIRTNFDMLPDGCMDSSKQTLFIKIAPQIAQIRHSAVHRLHLEHEKFLQQIKCAQTLAGLLHHPENMHILETVYSQVDASMRNLQYEAKIVKQKADYILSQLSQQREILLQRERQLREAVTKKYTELVAAASKEVLEPIETSQLTGGSEGTDNSNQPGKGVNIGVNFYENDIDNDEDRLQAELG